MFQQRDLVFDEVVAVTDKVRVKKQPIQVPKIWGPKEPVRAHTGSETELLQARKHIVFLTLTWSVTATSSIIMLFDRMNLRRNIYYEIIDYLPTSLNIDFGLPKGTYMTL